jgi:hypothetical protein
MSQQEEEVEEAVPPARAAGGSTHTARGAAAAASSWLDLLPDIVVARVAGLLSLRDMGRLICTAKRFATNVTCRQLRRQRIAAAVDSFNQPLADGGPGCFIPTWVDLGVVGSDTDGMGIALAIRHCINHGIHGGLAARHAAITQRLKGSHNESPAALRQDLEHVHRLMLSQPVIATSAGAVLDGGQLSKYLSDSDATAADVLVKLWRSFDIGGLSLVEALRVFVTVAPLPTEAQKIDRMLSAFSSWWFCSSIDSTHGVEEPVVKSAEAAYVMSYSVLMLNTDLFNDAIRPENRMSMDDFIRANVGVNDGDNLPVAMLADIYTNVAAHEIQSTTSTAAMQQGTDDTIMHVPEADGEAADDAPQVDETRQQRGYWVIFFDVDGVLNTTQPDSPSMGIEPPLLANLQRLAAAHRRPPPAVLDDHESGGQPTTLFILSSDWRREAALTEKAQQALEGAGLHYGGTVEPRLGKPAAIKRWLVENHHRTREQGQEGVAVQNWLAIDDHDLQGVDNAAAAVTAVGGGAKSSVFEGHFLRTDDSVGLTSERCDAGAAMLDRPWVGACRARDLARMESARHLALEEPTPTAMEKRLRCDECGVVLAGTAAAQQHMAETGCCMFSEV